jgi:DNA polymerase elongation subunit (family B)
MSYKYSRRYRPAIASRITELGREIIQFTRDYIESHSEGRIVLIDTDSVYVQDNTLSVEEISEAVNRHFHTIYPLELEKEDELNSLLLINRKKHYAYETKDGKYTHKGLAAVRSNAFPILKKLQIETIQLLLAGETNFRKIEDHIYKRIRDASLLDLAVPYTLGKDYTNGRSYKSKTVDWSIENIDKLYNNPAKTFNPEIGDKVYILEIRTGIDYDIKFGKFIALTYQQIIDDEFWRGEVIPAFTKITNSINKSIKSILDAVGVNRGESKQANLFDF